MSRGLRIGGGKYKGRLIASSGGDYRPTSAIVKKSLFDSIGDDISCSYFLDMFAGCGAVGLEAISRGAGFVCFIENHPQRLSTLRLNLDRLKVPESTAAIFGMDYSSGIHMLSLKKMEFDFIYIDPPYDNLAPVRILSQTATALILKKTGLIIYETFRHDARKVAESTPEMLYPVRERVLGSTALIFFRWRAE